ncbi:hypothetical protein T439DRAFT_356720 [Meredithblackwellia eburnea MCA 4105]
MKIFSKSTITFVSINGLRLLSIIAICLALSGEVVVMVSDIKGYQNRSVSAATPSSTSVAAASASVSSPSNKARRDVLPTTTSKLDISVSRTIINLAAASSPTATASPTTTTSSPQDAEQTEATDECSYVGNTSVPKTTGGILFTTLDRIFVSIFLIMMLFSEMPPPSKFTQRFWDYAFPPFGNGFGVGVLGVLQCFVGCAILSKSVSGLPQAAGWLLFIVSFLNILFGLAFGSSIKSLRSIISAPSQPSGLRQLSLSTRGAPMGSSSANNSTFYIHNNATQGSTYTRSEMGEMRNDNTNNFLKPTISRSPSIARSNVSGYHGDAASISYYVNGAVEEEAHEHHRRPPTRATSATNYAKSEMEESVVFPGRPSAAALGDGRSVAGHEEEEAGTIAGWRRKLFANVARENETSSLPSYR